MKRSVMTPKAKAYADTHLADTLMVLNVFVQIGATTLPAYYFTGFEENVEVAIKAKYLERKDDALTISELAKTRLHDLFQIHRAEVSTEGKVY